MSRTLRTMVAIALTVAFALAGFAQSNSSQTTTESDRAEAYYHFTRARLLDEQGLWSQAIEEYEKALQLDPRNSSFIYSEMADTYYRHRRAPEAVETAEKAIQANPDNVEAHRLLSMIYAAMLSNAGQTVPLEVVDRAIHEFEEVVRLDPTDRQSYLMLGQLYQFKNEPEKALAIYESFLGIEPSSEDGISALAKLHIDAGNEQAAIELLEDFVRTRPDSVAALDALGQAYSNLQEFGSAAEAYGKARELEPDDLELKKAHAQALFFNDDFAESGEIYDDLLETEPEDGIALLRLGQIHRQQMNYDLARTYLEKALSIFADSMEVQFHFVLLERDEGRLQDAIDRVTDILNRTERANGRYTEGERQNRRVFLTHLALLSSMFGNYDQAIDAFTQLKAISPDDADRIDASIADTYRTAGDLDKAIEYSEGALQDRPESRDLQITHADLIAEEGRVQEAIQVLERLMQGNDEDLPVLSGMANIYQRAGRLDQAHSVAETALRRFPEDDRVYFLQGSIFESERKYDDAEVAFRRALEIDGDNPAVLNYLGYMLADRGVKLEEALAMILKAVEADPTNGHYLDSLGWAYFRLNRLDLAEHYLNRALLFVTNNATIHDHLGDLYFRTNRYEEAQAAWTRSLQLGDDPEEMERIRKKLDGLKTRLANNR